VSFCDHCSGQRFDRAQVLRALRAARRRLRGKTSREAEQVLASAIEAVRTLEVPHFDPIDDEYVDGEVIH
jgi:hypothetical protein